jgi:hypothetical protein
MYEGKYKSNDNCLQQGHIRTHSQSDHTIMFGEFQTSYQWPALCQLYIKDVVMLVPLSDSFIHSFIHLFTFMQSTTGTTMGHRYGTSQNVSNSKYVSNMRYMSQKNKSQYIIDMNIVVKIQYHNM